MYWKSRVFLISFYTPHKTNKITKYIHYIPNPLDTLHFSHCRVLRKLRVLFVLKIRKPVNQGGCVYSLYFFFPLQLCSTVSTEPDQDLFKAMIWGTPSFHHLRTLWFHLASNGTTKLSNCACSKRWINFV